MPYTIAVFDLDGTLLDTLDDLTDAVNEALFRFNFPARTRDEVRSFVGNGVERLVRLSVPEGTDEDTLIACLSVFKEMYAAGCDRHTQPYPGILSLLDELRACGVRVAVVSNKFDAAVKALCARYFGDRVEVAVGERATVRKKPAPDTVFEALAALGVSSEKKHSVRAVYIGDSDVDILTARAADMPCLSVTWGFRDAAFLKESGATVLVDDADELRAAILG